MNNKAWNKTGVAVFLTVSAAFAVVGCGSQWKSEPRMVEKDFGNSARRLVEAQTANPEVAANPSPDPLDQLDANKTSEILKVYRKDVGSPKKAEQPVTINIRGGGSSGG